MDKVDLEVLQFIVDNPELWLENFRTIATDARQSGKMTENDNLGLEFGVKALEGLIKLKQKLEASVESSLSDLLQWAISCWKSEVANRPLVNRNRRPLDDTWRQVVRYAGGNPEELLGPNHDTLLIGHPSEQELYSQAMQDVLAERTRQVRDLGYDAEHDDAHREDEIPAMAAFYIMPEACRDWPGFDHSVPLGESMVPNHWAVPNCPDRREQLVRGAAMAIAEIERLDRETAKTCDTPKPIGSVQP